MWFHTFCPERYQGFDETVTVDKIKTCSICYDTKSDVITECKHQYCSGCIDKWLKCNKTCPMCRAKCYKCVPIVQG